jgi:hypothetical protein
MSSLGSINLRVDKLPQENFYKGKDGAVYCLINISINDESKFGNNVAATIPQSEEERSSKRPKTYIGNGKIYWTDGSIKTAVKEEQIPSEKDELPF